MTYIASEVVPTIRRMELINKKDFAKAILNGDVETYVVYVSFLCLSSIIIH